MRALGSILWLLMGLASCGGESDLDASAGSAVAPRLSFQHDAGGSGRRYFVETMGSGCGFLDADGDDDLDVLLLNGARLPGCDRSGFHSQLFRNDGQGNFSAWGPGWPAAVIGYAMGCAAGDLDNDGDTDLFIACYGPDVLLINEAGTFVDRSEASGLAGTGWSTSAAFLDSNRDGNLDLYVTRYVVYQLDADHLCVNAEGQGEFCEPDAFEAEQDGFYRGRGDGTFEEATEVAGLSLQKPGRGLGVVPTDYDLDGHVDLFIGNDRTPGLLFHNAGAGRFEEVGLLAGVAFASDGQVRSGMGVASGDYDGDGRFDLLVVNYANEPATLFRNLDAGWFDDLTFASGVGEATVRTLGFGVGFFDQDLDGDLDLFIANGHVLDTIERYGMGQLYRQKNQLLVNRGDGSFEVGDGPWPGAQQAAVSRGLAFGDVDNDGDVDLLVSNCNDRAQLILQPGSPRNQWIGLQLEGRSPSPRCAYGARVLCETMSRTLIRELQPGYSYLSSSDPRLLLGLGQTNGAVRVTVTWPSGKVQSFAGLQPGRYHKLKES
jgi:hypothetical protein